MPFLPCILYEDNDLLVANKPAGINTHQVAKDAPWGIYELLMIHGGYRAKLGIHQRLDRETSGVLILAKSPRANESLSRQFTEHTIVKTYEFVTPKENSKSNFSVDSPIDGKPSTTEFLFQEKIPSGFLWRAKPLTGRTHQIRIHAKQSNIPILGDVDERAEPLLLHALSIELKHPGSGKSVIFQSPRPEYFQLSSSQERSIACAFRIRNLLINPEATTACRVVHREGDRVHGLTVDRYGDFLYVEDFRRTAKRSLPEPWTDPEKLKRISGLDAKGCVLSIAAQGEQRADKTLLWGTKPPTEFEIQENGVRYLIDLMSPGGTGIFLDQRENRRRIRELSRGKRVLNLFSYTCGFSVAAAMGGASETYCVDLSKRILEWGKKNFAANGVSLNHHKLWADDVRDVIRRLGSRKEKFDIIVLDPPSFSRSKSSGAFSVKKDFEKLVADLCPLMNSGAWLLASSNSAEWNYKSFEQAVSGGFTSGRRKIVEEVYGPQTFDFPVSEDCPAYLKTKWVRVV